MIPNSAEDNSSTRKIDLVIPTSGKLFFEQKDDFKFCKPHLMPLKSLTLEKLERMQQEAHKAHKETREAAQN